MNIEWLNIENMVLEYIEKNWIELDNSYLERYPEKASSDYYDTEAYEIYIYELAYQRTLDYLYENKFLD